MRLIGYLCALFSKKRKMRATTIAVECYEITDLLLGVNDKEITALAAKLGISRRVKVVISEKGGIRPNGHRYSGTINVKDNSVIIFMDSIFAQAMDEQIYAGASVLECLLDLIHRTYYHELRHLWQTQNYRFWFDLDLLIWKNLSLIFPVFLLYETFMLLRHGFNPAGALLLITGFAVAKIFHQFWQMNFKRWYNYFSVTEQDALRYEELSELPDNPFIFFPLEVATELTIKRVPLSRSHV